MREISYSNLMMLLATIPKYKSKKDDQDKEKSSPDGSKTIGFFDFLNKQFQDGTESK